jgi:hypothetical protein
VAVVSIWGISQAYSDGGKREAESETEMVQDLCEGSESYVSQPSQRESEGGNEKLEPQKADVQTGEETVGWNADPAGMEGE